MNQDPSQNKTPPSPPINPIRIVSRGSMLALWQARFVAQQLEVHGAKTSIQIVKTTGDRVQDRFLHEIGGKGLFVKELEHSLLNKEADIAVHSLKDMPAQIKSPFILTAILKRHSPRDLLIFGPAMAAKMGKKPSLSPETEEPLLGAEDVARLGECFIATGSLRRTALLKAYAPQVKTSPIRGNVDTRLQKLASGEWDAMILAEASLDRLGFKSQHPSAAIDPTWFIPCASQGALAIECREDSPVGGFVRKVLNDSHTEHCVTLERRILELLGGDCTMPFGCLVSGKNTGMTIAAGIYSAQGTMAQSTTALPPLSSPPLSNQISDDLSFVKSWVEPEAHKTLEALRQAGGARVLNELQLPLPKSWL
jgi:hydroxymethylbilane synthase